MSRCLCLKHFFSRTRFFFFSTDPSKNTPTDEDTSFHHEYFLPADYPLPFRWNHQGLQGLPVAGGIRSINIHTIAFICLHLRNSLSAGP
jgi:hypothetical protein